MLEIFDRESKEFRIGSDHSGSSAVKLIVVKCNETNGNVTTNSVSVLPNQHSNQMCKGAVLGLQLA